MNTRSATARARALARGEAAHSSKEIAHRHQTFYQGINFTNRSQRSKYKKLHEREVRSTKWAFPATIATLGIGNNFNLLCANVGLQHFVFQDAKTYRRLTLEFLSTLSHTVGLNPLGREDRITFRLMDQSFDMSLTEWCTHFGFTNNDGHTRYVHDMLHPHPVHLFYELCFEGHKHRASCIECPAIRYFYYVITNMLQERGEVSKVNEENMLILGKCPTPHTPMPTTSETPSTIWTTSPTLSETTPSTWRHTSPRGPNHGLRAIISHCHSDLSSLGLQKPKLGEVVFTSTLRLAAFIWINCNEIVLKLAVELRNTRVGLF